MARRFGGVVPLLAVAALVAACGSSSSSSSSSTASGSTGNSGSATASATTGNSGTSTSGSSGSSGSSASISVASFNPNFTAMASLKSLASSGKGKIAAILPDTTSSTRYTEFDAPYLKKAATSAGLPSSDIIVQNGNGSDSTFLSDAQSDITNGASILLIDPEDAGTGAKVAQYAAAHGAEVVDYDRLTAGKYYVSFNNYTVGGVMAKGLVSCANQWGVKSPQVIFMKGAPTDNNATQFYQGSQKVLDPLFKSGKYKLLATPAGTWTPNVAQSEFEQAFTANPTANAALIPNDENGAPIITYLKSKGVKPYTFPTTGQDNTLTGLQNIISGYQCGTVYKPVYKEAQAAVALAMYLRAGKTPPSSLLNGTTVNPVGKAKVASVLLKPTWVTPKTITSSVIADKVITAKQLCTKAYAADCKKYKIG
jgi:D-xylose transport system substrate-binding protein